jgi:hypothetical protein
MNAISLARWLVQNGLCLGFDVQSASILTIQFRRSVVGSLALFVKSISFMHASFSQTRLRRNSVRVRKPCGQPAAPTVKAEPAEMRKLRKHLSRKLAEASLTARLALLRWGCSPRDARCPSRSGIGAANKRTAVAGYHEQIHARAPNIANCLSRSSLLQSRCRWVLMLCNRIDPGSMISLQPTAQLDGRSIHHGQQPIIAAYRANARSDSR